MAEKVPGTIYRPDKKSKESIRESEMNFPYRTISNPSNINLVSVSLLVRKELLNLLTKLIKFTDQQKLLKKQETAEINLSPYVSTKYLPI